ncbi:MAG: hypothetical protein ABSA13_06370 [Beijerinckiaceae bacterium]|jgi:hypothetical protein
MSGIHRPNQGNARESTRVAASRSPSCFAGSSDAKLRAILASLRHALIAAAPQSGEPASSRDAANAAGLSQNF